MNGGERGESRSLHFRLSFVTASVPLVTRTVRLSSLYVHPFALRSVSLGTPLRGRNGR